MDMTQTPGQGSAMDQGAAQAQAPDQAKPDDSLGGFLIILHIGDDGKISVGTETDQEEAQEGQDGGGEGAADESDEGFQEVGSMKEALTMALEIYRSKGQMPGGMSGPAKSAAFQAGYEED